MLVETLGSMEPRLKITVLENSNLIEVFRRQPFIVYLEVLKTFDMYCTPYD